MFSCGMWSFHDVETMCVFVSRGLAACGRVGLEALPCLVLPCIALYCLVLPCTALYCSRELQMGEEKKPKPMKLGEAVAKVRQSEGRGVK